MTLSLFPYLADAALVDDMFQALAATPFLAQNQALLEQICRELPRMAKQRMVESVIAALKIGDWNGGGFVPINCLGLYKPGAQVNGYENKAGVHPLPFSSDGRSSMWPDLEDEDTLDASRWKPKPRQEVDLYRVTLPNLGSRDVLQLLLDFGNPQKAIWESAVMTAVIETVWQLCFRRIHMRAFALFMCEVTTFTVSALLVADDADDAYISAGNHTSTNITNTFTQQPLPPNRGFSLLLDATLVLFVVYFIWLELLQHRVTDEEAPGALQRFRSLTTKFANPWNACDLLSQSLLLCSATAHAVHAPRNMLVSVMVVATFPLLFKTLGFDTPHLPSQLSQPELLLVLLRSGSSVASIMWTG